MGTGPLSTAASHRGGSPGTKLAHSPSREGCSDGAHLASTSKSASTLAIAAGQIFQWRKKHRVAQRELENKQQELREFTQLLLIKNSRLAELEQVARAGNSPSDPEQKNAATIPKAPTLSASKRDDDDLYSQHILTDSDWAVFKRHFDTSYPGYRQRLRHAFPQLTSAEERMFLLLKLNLSSKEAADMQGISLESIKKYRYRLRKRLGLEQEEGLELFVREF